MRANRVLPLLCLLCLSLTVNSPLLGQGIIVSELTPGQQKVATAKESLLKFQGTLKAGKWSQLIPLLSTKGRKSFVIEVCYVLAVSNEIETSGSEGLPPAMGELVKNVAAVNQTYELDEIGKLIFKGDIGEALKQMDATTKKWEIVNALWRAQSGSPFHMHPAFGNIVATQADGDTVYFDIEMTAVSAVSAAKPNKQPEFDLDGPAQVIRMVKVGNDWKYDGVDETRSAQRMETFIAGSEQPGAPGLLGDASFSGINYDGTQISSADYKGKIIILDFWGTWCAPCVASMPEMKLIRESFSKQGVEIIGIAADTKENVAAFCAKNEIPWPNIVDNEEALVKRFGVVAFPTLMVIDKNGKHVVSDIEKAELVADLIDRLDLDPDQYAGLKAIFEKKKQADSRTEAAETSQSNMNSR